GDGQDVIESAIGGASVSQTVEGRERYSINVRYLRDARSDLESLGRVLVAGPDGAQIPLAELADITVSTAPPSIHDEQGALAGYVSVDVAGRDLGTYVAEAKRALAERVSLPPGYRLGWAGQFEYLERARGRLALLVPLTLLIVFVLLYLNTASVTKTMIILLAVPFSAVGVMFMGLLPSMWSHGTGADVMKRIAAPMIGGIFTSFAMELLVYPAIYAIWRGREVPGA